MIDIQNGKFISAIFSNNAQSLVTGLWEDNSTEEKQTHEILMDVDLKDPFYNKLLESFSIDDIVKMTADQRNYEREGYISLVKEIALKEGILYDPNTPGNFKQRDVSFMLEIPKSEAEEEWLFDLKLEMFDNETIVNSDNDELKKRLRDASTPVEVMYIAGKFLFE